MTNEEKQLLLKDLCGRLPYGVKVERLSKILKLISVRPSYRYCLECELEEGVNMSYDIDDIKPYLRPMSSMTEEERKEQYKFSAWNNIEYYDWLNSYHFDYRGLIPRGLAIAVTEENNPYKEIEKEIVL